MKQSKLILFLLLLLFVQINTFSQDKISPNVVVTDGGFYLTSAGTQISWTIGDLITQSYIGENYSLTQGFQQQSYSFDIRNVITQSEFLSQINIYPNPFSSFFYVNIEPKNHSLLQLEICQMDGKILLIQNLIKGRNIVYLPLNSSKILVIRIVNNKKLLLESKIIQN